MRQRAFIHIDGSPGAGKTTFVERLLTMGWVSTCIRCVGPGERPRRDDLELYSRAGADCSAIFRVGTRDALEFFEIDAMQEYSQVVLIEGAKPAEGLDLSVFVTSACDHALLTRVQKDYLAEHHATIQFMEDSTKDHEGALRFLAHTISPELADRAKSSPTVLEDLRKNLAGQLDAVRQLQPPPPTMHWALSPHFRGIEKAQLVVINILSEEQRPLAEGISQEVHRLRRDPEVFDDVMDFRAKKLPITIVIANLADPKDAGLKKALTRVKRAWTKASAG